jgi:hypothetical protein
MVSLAMGRFLAYFETTVRGEEGGKKRGRGNDGIMYHNITIPGLL